MRAAPFPPRPLPAPRGDRRRGVSLDEVLVTGLLLGAAFTTMVPLLGWLVAERRAADQQQWALQEVSNVLERLTVLPAEERTPEAVGKIELSPAARSRLPEAKLKVTVAAPEAGSPLERVTAELRWTARGGVPATPVRLTTWLSPVESKP